ncbi:hypothetical protein ACEWY4_001266 [Coilia grayii]|uniref:C2H2-type domain-containing protein n=1 Tax=Coilia grayii TaxID=363190 RepID=A0ABD1KYZ4_9TELE
MTNVNYGSLQTQLGTIMEVLAKAAIAEIIKLFDDSYAVLRLEISRHQNENEHLKRKLQEAKEELRTVQIRIEEDEMVRQDWSSPFRTGIAVNGGGNPEQNLSTEDKQCLGVQKQESNLMQIKEERLEDELWHQGLESMKYETTPAPAGDTAGISQRLYTQGPNSQYHPESVPEQQQSQPSFPFPQDHQTTQMSCMPDVNVQAFSEVSSVTYASDPDTHSPQMALKQTHTQTMDRGLPDAQDGEASATHLAKDFHDRGNPEEEFGALRLKTMQQEDERASVGRGASGVGSRVEPMSGSERQADGQEGGHGEALLWGRLTSEIDGEQDSDTNHSFEELLEQYDHPHGDELHLDAPQTPPSVSVVGETSVEGFAVAPGTYVAATLPQPQPHLLLHLRHTPLGGRQAPPPPPPAEHLALHVCSICKKAFSTLPYLRKHLRSHSGERPFTCSVCYKHFLCSSHLTIHLRTHTGERPYACHTCGKRFTQQSSLKTHQSVHSGLRPYSCPHCGKNYTLMHHLKRHMGTHEKC